MMTIKLYIFNQTNSYHFLVAYFGLKRTKQNIFRTAFFSVDPRKYHIEPFFSVVLSLWHHLVLHASTHSI